MLNTDAVLVQLAGVINRVMVGLMTGEARRNHGRTGMMTSDAMAKTHRALSSSMMLSCEGELSKLLATSKLVGRRPEQLPKEVSGPALLSFHQASRPASSCSSRRNASSSPHILLDRKRKRKR